MAGSSKTCRRSLTNLGCRFCRLLTLWSAFAKVFSSGSQMIAMSTSAKDENPCTRARPRPWTPNTARRIFSLGLSAAPAAVRADNAATEAAEVRRKRRRFSVDMVGLQVIRWEASYFRKFIAATGREQCSGQCLPQILLQIVGVFDADTETDQAVIDAAGAADVGGDAGMGHCRRMADQRFDTAETLSEAEQFRARQEALSCRTAAFEANADHAAEIAHLSLGDLVSRMRRQTRIIDVLHLRLLVQPGG